MKPDVPAKAGPAPPAEADGNCGRSGRGSLQLVVVRELTACSTRTRTGRAVKRGGRPGQLHTDRPCSGEPVPAITHAPSRVVPENPPASTRSPVLVGRTEREKPKLQSPDPRPSPGTPVGDRVRPAQLPALPHSLPPGAYTKPTRYRAPIMSPGVGRHISGCGDRQYTVC